ncbi:helix-turn-helix transcriptional regulator [Mycobacteroides abscessus]|uniref:helix-turn-helix transcriptional regulator n=2 Tax=Mycobacteroides abscessus TaxID=36809 RepID=UPI00355BC4D4
MYSSPARSSRMQKSQNGSRHDPLELLTIVELSERLRVSVGCIRAWRLRGEGPPAIRVGSALRWDTTEVDAWLDEQRESRWAAG